MLKVNLGGTWKSALPCAGGRADFHVRPDGGFPYRPRRRPWRKIILGLVVALLALPACAALQFDVWIGFDGIIPQAGWFPVTCEIFNDGPGFSGRFVLV